MQTAKKPDTRQKLLDGLAQQIGSEAEFRHWTRCLVYTEGVQFLAEQAGAYWLIDLIASWCVDPRIQANEFVHWKLTVNADRTAIALADDGNGNEILRQDIPFTDFPLDEITLFLTDRTLLLPSEY
jgi:hypothetical protein